MELVHVMRLSEFSAVELSRIESLTPMSFLLLPLLSSYNRYPL